MADFEDVVSNEQVAAIADVIRHVTRTTAGMTVPQMPERLSEIRATMYARETVAVQRGSTEFVISGIDTEYKHMLVAIPATNDDYEKLASLSPAIEGSYNAGEARFQIKSQSKDLSINLIVIDYLLAQSDTTAAFCIPTFDGYLKEQIDTYLAAKLDYPYKDAATKSKDCIVVIDYSGNVSGRAYTQYPTHNNTTVPSATTIMSRNADGWSRVNTPTDLNSNDGTLIVNKSYLKELLQKREAVIRLTFNKQLAAKLELTVTANTVVDWGDSVVTIGYNKYLYKDRGINVGTISHTYTGGTLYEVLVYLNGTEVPSRFCYSQAGLVGAVLPEGLTRFNQVKYNASDVLDYQAGTIWKANTFARCSNLKSIKLPDSLTYVGDYTFEYCTGLETAVLSRGYRKVTDYMFYHCTALKGVTLPDGEMIPNISGNSPVTIGQAGFEGCTSLTHIEIPYGYTGIGDKAFKDCTSLRAVSFWNSMAQAAKANTFSGCNALSDIFYSGSKSQFDAMLKQDGGNEAYWVASKHYMLSKTLSGALIEIMAMSDEWYSFKAPVTGPVTWHFVENADYEQVIVMEGVPAGEYQTTDGQHTVTIDSQGFVSIDGIPEKGMNSGVWNVVYEYDDLGSGIKIYLHNFTLVADTTSTPVSLFTTRATPYTEEELVVMFKLKKMYLHVLNSIQSSSTSATEYIYALSSGGMRVRVGQAGSSSGWVTKVVSAVQNYQIVEMAE